MRRRSGFALLVALWATIGATALAMASAAAVRDDLRAATERNELVAALWKGEGCIARVRSTIDGLMADSSLAGRNAAQLWQALDLVNSTALEEAGCHAEFSPSGMLLDINLLSQLQLTRILARPSIDSARADSLASALLDWRDADDIARSAGAERPDYAPRGARPPSNAPISDAREILQVRGWDALGEIASLFGAAHEVVTLSHAPLAVLRLLPGMSDEAASTVVRLRGPAHNPVSLDAVAANLSPVARDAFVANLLVLSAVTTGVPDRWRVRVGVRLGRHQSPFVQVATLKRDGIGVAVTGVTVEWL